MGSCSQNLKKRKLGKQNFDTLITRSVFCGKNLIKKMYFNYGNVDLNNVIVIRLGVYIYSSLLVWLCSAYLGGLALFLELSRFF